MVSRDSGSFLRFLRPLSLYSGTSGAFGPNNNRTVIQYFLPLLNHGSSSANYVEGVASGRSGVLKGLKGKPAILMFLTMPVG
jgi:hypothetical protein